MKDRLSSPAAEVKKNLLFDRLIKRYKYVAGKTNGIDKHERIVRKGDFPSPEFPFFNLPEGTAQKKNASAQGLSQKLRDTTKTIAVAESAKACSSKPPFSDIQQNIIESADMQAKGEIRQKSDAEKSYDQGFEAGRLSGLAEGNARAEKVSRIINNIVEEFNKESKRFFSEIENMVMDLSVFLAEKIVGEAATNMPDVVKENVEKCVGLLAGAGNVILKINPGDYEVIKGNVPGLEMKYDGKYSFVIEPDQNITRGGCLVEIDGSVIDGRIETQFNKLKQQMEMLT